MIQLKKLIGPLALLLISSTGLSQNYLGFSHSRFAGVLGVEVNPASILTDDLKSDWLIPVGLDLSIQNNVFSYRKSSALGIRGFADGTDSYDEPKTGRGNLRLNVNGPGFMIRLSEKHAFAVTSKQRTYLNIKANDKFLDLFDGDFFDLFDNPFESFVTGSAGFDTDVEITAMSWLEGNLTYSRKVWENKYDNFKVGITGKVLNGLAASHADLQIDELKLDINSPVITGTLETELEEFIASASEQDLQDFLDELAIDSTAEIPGTGGLEIDLTKTDEAEESSLDALLDVAGQIDYSSNLEDPSLQNTLLSYWGLGLDIGFVYEFKENPKKFNKYLRRRVHKPIHSRREDPPYKWKLGVSVMDIGRIKYDRGNETYKSNGGETVEINIFEDDPIETLNEISGDFDDFFDDPENNQDSISQYNDLRKTSGDFTVGLPTTLNIDWDYHWKKTFYLNVNAWISMAAFKFSDYTVRNISKINITPRMERDALALFIPMSINYMGDFNMGVGFRGGPFMLGIQNIGPVLFQKKVNRFGFYFAFAKGFAVKKKKDESKSIYFRDELKRYNR